MKTIVLVEDNSMFRSTIKEYFELKGKLKCHAFGKPKEALEFVVTNRAEIDGVVTDYEMGAMNGFQLSEKLLKQFPDLKIVLMSGHDVNYLREICKKYNLEDKVELLSKSRLDSLLELI